MFAWGNLTVTYDCTGCLRYQVIRHNGHPEHKSILDDKSDTMDFLDTLNTRVLFETVSLMLENEETKKTLWLNLGKQKHEISIDTEGRICINGRKSLFTTHQLLEYRAQLKLAIDQSQIKNRPYKWDRKRSSPCNKCPFNESCKLYDSGEFELPETFISYSLSTLHKEN